MNKRSLYKEFFGAKPAVKEAELVNKMADYAGGVVYKLHDPSTYDVVKMKIMNFAKERNLFIVQAKFNPTSNKGYLYFRMGADAASEAQRIQGYLSQLPELVKFKFKVIEQKSK